MISRRISEKIRMHFSYMMVATLWYLILSYWGRETTTDHEASSQLVEEVVESPGALGNVLPSGEDPEEQIVSELENALAQLKEERGLPDPASFPRQKKVILISGWRQGSSFAQDVIASHPHVLKMYEPLIIFKHIYLRKLRSWEQEPMAKQFILDMLSCRVTQHSATKIRGNKLILGASDVLQHCKATVFGDEFCYTTEHLEGLCKSFPIVLLKFVRFPVFLALELLQEFTKDDLHIVYLPRDPRAVLSSRWNPHKTRWCNTDDCNSADVVCKDMDSDLTAILQLQKMHPGKVHLLRYEDVALNPEESARKLFAALHIEFREETTKYLLEHTQANRGRKTFRDSMSRIIAWSTEMNKTNLEIVQKSCAGIMERFGYIPTHKKVFELKDVIVPLPAAL